MEKEKLKKLKLEEFKKLLIKNSDNVFTGEGLAEHFESIDCNFMIVCKKCGSSKVEIIGKDGKDFGNQTGYSPSSNVIKCNNCGNADTIYL